MRKLLLAVLPVAVGMACVGLIEARQQKPLRASIVDTHEGITITVDPWTQASQYKDKFPKKSPFQAGIIALRIVAKNENDIGVTLNRERIRLLVQIDEDHRQELQAMSADDVADAVILKRNGKDPTARRVPLPIPLGSGAKPSRDKNWTELRDACQDAALPSNVIAAHGSVDGLVYFDLRGEVDMVPSSRLYLPDLQKMGSRDAISYFDIDLSGKKGD